MEALSAATLAVRTSELLSAAASTSLVELMVVWSPPVAAAAPVPAAAAVLRAAAPADAAAAEAGAAVAVTLGSAPRAELTSLDIFTGVPPTALPHRRRLLRL